MIEQDERDAALTLLRSPHPFVRMRLAYGSFVGVRYPYLYMETPKAACTTTKAHLWRLEGLGPLPDANGAHARPHGDPRPSLRTLGEAAALEVLRSPRVIRFLVWRDPASRLASAWMSKIRLGRDPGEEWIWWRRRIAERFGLAPDADIGFDEFARFACELPDPEREEHFRSQFRLSLFNFIRYDRIVRFDRYAEDFAALLGDLGVSAARGPDLTRRENASGSEEIEASRSTRAMIREAYAQDYAMVRRGLDSP